MRLRGRGVWTCVRRRPAAPPLGGSVYRDGHACSVRGLLFRVQGVAGIRWTRCPSTRSETPRWDRLVFLQLREGPAGEGLPDRPSSRRGSGGPARRALPPTRPPSAVGRFLGRGGDRP